MPLRDAIQIRRLFRIRGTKPDSPRLQEVYVRPLQTRILLREGTTDAAVVSDTFVGLFHLPPPEIPDPRTILDLGSNIGLTVAHYAVLYPRARVLGIELDPETAELARRNVHRWDDRCEVMTGAAWVREEKVPFDRVLGEEYGAHVGVASETSTYVQGYSIGSLVDRLGGSVDYLKMDIEGGEDDVLAENIGWAEAVLSMKVEVHHGPEALGDCSRRLRNLGFLVRPDERHPDGLVAVRS